MIFMTPAEFDKRIDEIKQLKDDDEARVKAEALMCSVLQSLGYGTGIRKYFERWNRRDNL